MAVHTTGWQCINQCNVFEALGVPTFCPYCGSRELYPQDDGMVRYDRAEESYVNSAVRE